MTSEAPRSCLFQLSHHRILTALFGRGVGLSNGIDLPSWAFASPSFPVSEQILVCVVAKAGTVMFMASTVAVARFVGEIASNVFTKDIVVIGTE